MPRPIWSGSISFGLVNVPVKLVSAVSPKEVRFHMVHDKDGGRIKQKRVCSVDGKEVPYEHISKGYELSPGQYVMISPEELEALDPKATRTIDIEQFVSLDEIDPIYFESTYHLVPDKGAAKAYALLHDALVNAKKVGIARMVLRTKQYLCALRPMDNALSLSTMLYDDEVVKPKSLEGLPDQKPKAQELGMAEKLIEQLSGPFKPAAYKDTYREEVEKLIQKKAEGEQIVTPPEEERAPAKVVDLMSALKASLAAQGRAPPEEARGERRHRAHAARTKRSGKRRAS